MMMPRITPKSEVLSVAARAILAARPASSPIRVRRRYLSIRFFRSCWSAEQDERCPCAYAVVANTLFFSTLDSRSRTKVAYLLIDHFDIFGLRQVYLHLRRRKFTPIRFKTPGPYQCVRRPLYLGWLFAFWSTP